MKGARQSGGPGPTSASHRARLADEHHAKGYSFRKQGDFAAAIEEYSQAIVLEPQHFKALFNRGFSWDKVHCTLAFGMHPQCRMCNRVQGWPSGPLSHMALVRLKRGGAWQAQPVIGHYTSFCSHGKTALQMLRRHSLRSTLWTGNARLIYEQKAVQMCNCSS